MTPFKMICPVCQKDNDLLSAIETSETPPPVQGDAGICFGCATVLIFDGHPLRLRLPREDEDIIYDDPLIASARMAVIEQRVVRAQQAQEPSS